jgi:hypothetical protein
MIALLSFFLNYIPNFGPFIATLLPIPIVLLDSSISQATGVLAILIPAFIHMVVGNVIEPVVFMQDDAIDMHPVVNVACIIVWYIIWGVPGAILAVPITTLMRIVATQVSGNNPKNSLAFVVKCVLEGEMPYTSREDYDKMIAASDAGNAGNGSSVDGGGGGGSPSARPRLRVTSTFGRRVPKDVEDGKVGGGDAKGTKTLTQMFQFVLLSIALGWLLVYLKEVTIPYVLSLFLMFLFSPLADATEGVLYSGGRCCCCQCCDVKTEEERSRLDV